MDEPDRDAAREWAKEAATRTGFAADTVTLQNVARSHLELDRKLRESVDRETEALARAERAEAKVSDAHAAITSLVQEMGKSDRDRDAALAKLAEIRTVMGERYHLAMGGFRVVLVSELERILAPTEPEEK